MRGWEGHPSYPFSPSRMWAVDADQSADCLPASGAWIICPWSIAWWWLWMWWPVIATCVDGLPLYGSLDCRLSAEWLSALDPESRSSPCPASVMCAGVVFPWSSRSVPTQEQSPQLPWLASDFKDGCPPASWVRVYVWLYPAVPCTWHGYGSLEPARPCSRWPRHLVHSWSGAWSVWLWDDSEVVPTPVCWWRSAGGQTHRDWQMDVTSELLCVRLEADKCVWSRQRSWATDVEYR